LYIKKQVETTPTEIKAAVEQVPLEVKPIQDFVTSCVEQTGEQGIRKLGSQGGITDISDLKINFADPTEGDAVSFGGIVVPYWSYLKSPNECPEGCVIQINKPVLRGTSPDSYESQISKYIDNNLKGCLEGFAKFKNEGFDIAEVSDVKTTTTIGDNNVYVGVSYTIDATKDTVKQRMTQYAASFPVNLKRIYSLANEIIEMELNYSYFEMATMDMITAYSGLDINKMPPFSQVEFKQSPTVPVWPIAIVAENFKEAIGPNIARFQIMGTKNYARKMYNGAFVQSISDNYILGPMKGSYGDLSASFAYLNWPVYLKINKGATAVKPVNKLNLQMFFLSVQTYDAIYDVSYPVVIQIEDKKAFNNRGFSFNLALESNIRENEALTGNYVSFPVTPSGVPLLCNENQRVSGNITIIATDLISNAKLDGVQVVFNCGETSCAMGTTNSNGRLTTKFPLCIGGSLSYSKDGYFAKSNQLSTSVNGRSRSIQAGLYKKVKFNVTVLKKEKTIGSIKGKRAYPFNPIAVPIGESEQAILTFNRVAEFGEADLNQVVVYSNETKFAEIELVPGDYEVGGSLIFNKRVIIPKDPCYKCTGGTWYNFGSCDCIEMDEIVMDKLPRGGLTFDKPELYWKVVSQDIINNKELYVYVISTLDGFSVDENGTTSPPLKHDDLKELGKTDEYSMVYRTALEPDFR
jgi:hypothetical protein